MTGHARLAARVSDLADQGTPVPCAHPLAGALWTSDDHDDRKLAARACSPCPILDQCATVARRERWHVWAGRDHTGGKHRVAPEVAPQPPSTPQPDREAA